MAGDGLQLKPSPPARNSKFFIAATVTLRGEGRTVGYILTTQVEQGPGRCSPSAENRKARSTWPNADRGLDERNTSPEISPRTRTQTSEASREQQDVEIIAPLAVAGLVDLRGLPR